MKKLSLLLLLSCVFSGGLNAAENATNSGSGSSHVPDGTKDEFQDNKEKGGPESELGRGSRSNSPKAKKATALAQLRAGASGLGRAAVEGGPVVGGFLLSTKALNLAEMRFKEGAVQAATAGAGAYLVYDASRRYLRRQTPLTNVLGEFGQGHTVAVNGTALAALAGAVYYGASRLGYERVATGTLLAAAALTAGRQAVEVTTNALRKPVQQ